MPYIQRASGNEKFLDARNYIHCQVSSPMRKETMREAILFAQY